MPKSDTPATRRSARVAAASAGPASKVRLQSWMGIASPSPAKTRRNDAPLTTQANASAASTGAKASGKAASDEAEKASKSAKGSKADKDTEKDGDKADGHAEGGAEKPKAVTSRGVLKLGQTLPPIVLEDNTGAEVDVSTLAGERGVVLFLYPRVSSPRRSALLRTRRRRDGC